jgi:hypothetical protein
LALQETGWKVPIAVSGFDPSFQKEDAPSMDGKTTDDHAGIVVMNLPAIGAEEPLEAIPFGDPGPDALAPAVAAIVHRRLILPP